MAATTGRMPGIPGQLTRPAAGRGANASAVLAESGARAGLDRRIKVRALQFAASAADRAVPEHGLADKPGGHSLKERTARGGP
jgi:hypothetical protein